MVGNADGNGKGGATGGADRQRRLAEALRANLGRRKAQARGRAVGSAADSDRPVAAPAVAKPPETDG